MEKAALARTLCRRVGSPTLRNLSKWLNDGQIANCPITSKDARLAELIHGVDVVKLRGKMSKKTQRINVEPVKVKIPLSLRDKYKSVRLYMDVMYTNGLSFLHTISGKIEFRTISYLMSETKESLAQSIFDVIKLYRRGGFKICFIDADGKFTKVKDCFEETEVEIIDPLNHVNIVERSIRTVKEGVRCIVAALPFRRITRLMVRRLAELVVRNLNQFPAENGISKEFSPLTIVAGKPRVNY